MSHRVLHEDADVAVFGFDSRRCALGCPRGWLHTAGSLGVPRGSAAFRYWGTEGRVSMRRVSLTEQLGMLGFREESNRAEDPVWPR